MTSIRGINQEGEKSFRCLNNTGPRRFLVVECDPKKWENLNAAERACYADEAAYIAVKKDEAAGVLWHLVQTARQFPLVLVVDTAGKSLHGWFLVAGAPEEEVRRFFRYAVALGADQATWIRCQFVRVPNGTRDNGKRQSAIYFNPEPLEVK
jgi:hypothetical protein